MCLSASDWRGLNRNQIQTAILEIENAYIKTERVDSVERFLIDDKGRTKKKLKPLLISPTLRREMHGNESRVVEPHGWKHKETIKKENDRLMESNTAFSPNSFKYVSLFSGIGGFEQALNNLGGECVLASEIDKFAEQSYQALYGHSTAGDITKIDTADIPEHDLLVGGFPCQAFSVAGNRKGFEDARGTLFFEIVRLAKEKQPKALLLENVKGLVNHDKGKTLEIMIQTLCEIGYTVDFEILNSKYFGVPQNRERIFIVAIRSDLIQQEDWTIEGQTIIPKGKMRIQKLDGIKSFNFNYPQQNDVTVRLRDILESNIDEKYYLSDDKTAALIARLGTATLKDTDDCDMVGHVDIKGHDAIKRVYSPQGIGNALTTMGGGHREPKIAELQGLPIREATKQGYTLAEEGDTVNFQFPDSKTRRGRVGKEIANTLEASNINQGVVEAIEPSINIIGSTAPPTAKGTNSRQWIHLADNNLVEALGAGDYKQPKQLWGESTKYRIRKLTPRECWRLQGFPDEAFETVKAAGLSDSQLYKQAGNGVTVNVIEAIARNLIPYLK